jgi:putative selenium metabolism protein SsnA
MTQALTGGLVLTSLDPVSLRAADVVIDDGRVKSVGEASAGASRRNCEGCLIVPGNVCAHTHLYSALARGMPYALEAPSNFLEILRRIWWRLDRALDEESIRASALVGGMAALLAGTTTVVDHHASPSAIDGSLDIVADALGELGLRSVLCYEVTDRDGAERASAGVRENERFLASGRELARGLVGAHASFTMSEETLSACVDLADRAGLGIHIHVAEDAADQVDARERFGTGVVGRLAEAGALGDRSVLAHCVHLDEGERTIVRETGAWIAHNATSNMNNAVGRAPVGALGEQVALGTDGIGGDMFAESKTAYFRAREDDVFTPISWPLGRLGTGARLVAQAFDEPGFGTIAPGVPADLVVLDYPAPTPLVEDNVAGHWVFGIESRHVRDVLVGGELVVADGRLVRVDQDKLATDGAADASRLWNRLADVEPHPFERIGASG